MKPEACYQQCQYCHYTSDPMGKGTLGRVGLILLTRKPAPACARGFRVKTLKPSPWPGLHQQRIHRGEGKGEALGTQWGICHGSARCLSRAVVPGPHSIAGSPCGCSSRSCRAAQSCQSSIPTPQAGAVQFLTALKNSIQGSPIPEEGMIQHHSHSEQVLVTILLLLESALRANAPGQ